MIYNRCTFLDCYNVFSPLQTYFLPTHGNGEVPVLGKLPYIVISGHKGSGHVMYTQVQTRKSSYHVQYL
jgi:hypothetical protein